MVARPVKTAVVCPVDRYASLSLAAPYAQQVEATGVVDDVICWDQMVGWWPRALWTPDVTPVAQVAGDQDSFLDAFCVAAVVATATSRLGVSVSADAIRRGPGEYMQTMLTLAEATNGRATLMMGAGELKQAKPFGWKRSEGLARMEDLFRAFQLLRNPEGPVDFEGNIWKFQQAWIGGARPAQPKFWAMGGGPKLVELAAQYADGFVTALPCAFAYPEDYAAEVVQVKQALERNGRDPDDFDFGIWVMTLQHEDPDVMNAALDNKLLKWLSAIAGRFNQRQWERENLQSVFPPEWHYALKMLPASVTREEAEDVVSRVPRKMVEKSYIWGSPKEIAASLQEFVDAGATWVSPVDLLAATQPPEEGASSVARTLEICRILKGA